MTVISLQHVVMFPWLQLYVVLQSTEEINEEFVPPSSSARGIKANCTAHAHHIECCHNTKQTHFTLPVPQNVTQSFKIHAGWPHLHSLHIILHALPSSPFVIPHHPSFPHSSLPSSPIPLPLHTPPPPLHITTHFALQLSFNGNCILNLS